MYGIIIEGVRYMIEDHYGSATLALVLERAHVANLTFSTHDRYSEKIIPNLLIALSDITGNSVEEVGVLAGRYFVRFMMKYGHAELLKVLGRRFADFLKGLDSLHEYFRFSYPRIRPPSFYCDRETTDGLTLHYRSRRQGFISYVMGQLIEIAKVFFDQDITVELVRKEEKKGFQYVLLRVTFDNRDYNTDQLLRDKNTALNEFLPVDSLSVLTMFPYFIAFNKRMEIVVVGRALSHIIPELIGKRIDEEFDLLRPCVKFTWDACQHHLNNLFELETMYPVQKKTSNASIAFAVNDQVEDKVKLPSTIEHAQTDKTQEGRLSNGQRFINGTVNDDERADTVGNYLHLKGPMVYLKHSDVNIYLPTVLIESLDDLFDLGLYLNDYSASDCNREIIMASVQKSDDLKELLKREKEKSRTLAKNMREIDQARKTAKELLSQMMPREIANELIQTGKRSVTLCEAFDEVTIAFAKIVDFNLLTNDMPPMTVVSLLNIMFSLFDDVVSKHGVYKVETVGESYMISCGVPYPTQNHAEYIADTALDMLQSIQQGSTTFVEGKTVLVKVGMHSGSVVGGVVGLRAPRYCLFGDTVNCASRLESHNKQALSIQVSVKTKVLLENFAPGQFQFENRGKINLKGKGEMLAFGLLAKKGQPRSEKYPLTNTTAITGDNDNESAVYTPMDDFDDNSRASTMSRMSISMAGTRSKGSRSTGTSSSSAAAGSVAENEETSDREQGAKKKGTTAEEVLMAGYVNDQLIDEAKREKRRTKEMAKERRRKEKINHRGRHKDMDEEERNDKIEKGQTNQDGSSPKLDTVHAPAPAPAPTPTVVRGADTLGASTSNKAFLSVHNTPLQSTTTFEKAPAPVEHSQQNGEHTEHGEQQSEPNVFTKMKQSTKTVHSADTVEPVKAAKTKDVIQPAKPHESQAVKTNKTKNGLDSIKATSTDAPEPKALGEMGQANGQAVVDGDRVTKKRTGGQRTPATDDSTAAVNGNSQEQQDDATNTITGTMSKVMANRGKKGTPLVTADQIKAEARSILDNQIKAMEDMMKPSPLEKSPLPPISQASLEEVAKLSAMKNGRIDQPDGYTMTTVNENIPAECICGRYKEVQVMKTKACRLM